MTIQTLRRKLANKEIIWVDNSEIKEQRYLPGDIDGKNHTIILLVHQNMCRVDNGKEFHDLLMTMRQNDNLYEQFGFGKENSSTDTPK